MTEGNVLVAVAQVAPVFLKRRATIDRACEWIAKAGAAGARLVAFPEAYVPGYPDWIWAVPPGRGDVLGELYAELLDQSIDVTGPETDQLCDAAREAGTCVVMGVNERNTEASRTSIYNTLVFIGDDGRLLGKHRKLVPTSAERLVWAAGDGSTLKCVFDTSVGRVGGLICWENYMPLARYAMYAWGTEIYIAATWDRSDTWIATLQHIAKEGSVYVLGCCQALRKTDIPDGLRERFYADAGEWINVGNSAIVAPGGAIIAGPAVETEELLFAEINRKQLRADRYMLDVAGHYARPDVFGLTVNTTPHPMIQTRSVDSDAASETLQAIPAGAQDVAERQAGDRG